MQATAKLSDYRQAPRKVRLVADLVRGKSVEDALLELNFRAKRAAPVFAKLIQSAVANAKAQGIDITTLIIKEIRVDKGAILKRNRPRAQGRAFPIHKHTSHIMLTLTDDPVVKKGKAKKLANAEKDKKDTKEVKPEAKTKTTAAKKPTEKPTKKVVSKAK